jgi:hypothetical protein
MDRMKLQSAEFDAADKFASALRAHNMTAVVDDEYPEVRHRYEGALVELVKAMKANGRFEPGNRYALLDANHKPAPFGATENIGSCPPDHEFEVGCHVQIHRRGPYYGHNGVIRERYRDGHGKPSYGVKVLTGPDRDMKGTTVIDEADLKPK